MKRILLITLALLTALLLVACHDKAPLPFPDTDMNASVTEGENKTASVTPTNYVRFEMKNGGVFVMELLPQYAPETVANFQQLVSERFYDGKSFYRIMQGDIIQAGDPNNKDEIEGEFSSNGCAQNTLLHERGVVSMVKLSLKDSSKVNFMIVQGKSQTKYNGRYAAFGQVVYGMETIDAIAATEVTDTSTYTEKSKPVIPQEIKSAIFVEFREDWSTVE